MLSVGASAVRLAAFGGASQVFGGASRHQWLIMKSVAGDRGRLDRGSTIGATRKASVGDATSRVSRIIEYRSPRYYKARKLLQIGDNCLIGDQTSNKVFVLGKVPVAAIHCATVSIQENAPFAGALGGLIPVAESAALFSAH
jgi:hypothetical protein